DARQKMVSKDHELSQRRQCTLLQLSRSTLYYRPKGESAENLAFMEIIDRELRNEKLDFCLTSPKHLYYEDSPEEQVQYWLDQVGTEIVEESDQRRFAENEVVTVEGDPYSVSFYFRPGAILKGKSHPLYERFKEEQNWYNGAARLEIFKGEAFKAISERIESSPVPQGQYEANPLYCAPVLVEKVCEKLGLSEDGATFFLQTLTLYNPTTSNVRQWNGWTAARYNKAARELMDKKLIIEAKRARAGRKYFIDGGWDARKKPHLPVEVWKLSMYQTVEDGVPPLKNILPLEPLHRLFEKAWSRLENGDVPGF
ncbi:MAG: hypothetical protein ACNA8W_14665, partial [Bradymonadaceae bacterium]